MCYIGVKPFSAIFGRLQFSNQASELLKWHNQYVGRSLKMNSPVKRNAYNVSQFNLLLRNNNKHNFTIHR